MKPIVLAAGLCACAGALTGLAMARPGAVTVANAALFWAWAAVARSLWSGRAQGRACRACGAVDAGRLPDGSCLRCAAPAKGTGAAA